jgi:hypothetical protein
MSVSTKLELLLIVLIATISWISHFGSSCPRTAGSAAFTTQCTHTPNFTTFPFLRDTKEAHPENLSVLQHQVLQKNQINELRTAAEQPQARAFPRHRHRPVRHSFIF